MSKKESEKTNQEKGNDFLVEGPEIANGVRIGIRHREDHSISIINYSTVEEGKPLREGAEVMEVSRDGSNVARVLSSFKIEKGPIKVNSNKYREGWDAIFAKKELNKQLN